MQLILVRHALAEDREVFKKKNLDDRLRPLTIKGRKKMQKMAVALRDQITHVDLIVTSPLIRARQTAEILSQIFYEIPVIEAPELSPETAPAAFAKWLKSNSRNHKVIMAVGHEPHLGTLSTWLLTGKEERQISFKKGGAASFDCSTFNELRPGEAVLEWLLQPKNLV